MRRRLILVSCARFGRRRRSILAPTRVTFRRAWDLLRSRAVGYTRWPTPSHYPTMVIRRGWHQETSAPSCALAAVACGCGSPACRP
eukprot:1252674-Prymnesium_polylepis.1